MSVAGQDFILGFFVVDGKQYEFFSKFSQKLYEALKSGKVMDVEIRDVKIITFNEGEPNGE